MKLKHFVSAILISIVVLLVCSCSKSDSNNQEPPGGNGNPATGDIVGMAFPGDITVKKGTTVTWNNKDSNAHTVTSDDGTTFSSGNIAAGASFSYTAATVGTFTYHCAYHSNMKGKLIVTP